MAMIRSLPRVIPLRLSKGSFISNLFTIINIHVDNPKIAFIVTVAALVINAIFRHRDERTEIVVHNPSKRTPTTRITAAHINENNSITNVIDPIANKTRQKIVGTSDIYNQLSHSKHTWTPGDGGNYN